VEASLQSIRNALRRPLEAEFAKGQLTGPQRSAMAVVVRHREPLSVRELAKAMNLAQSTVSGIIERLVQRGMLVRSGDPKDGRVARIAASPEVRTFLEERMPQLTLSPLVRALANASRADREQIRRAMRKLEHLLSQGREPAELEPQRINDT
jgi:DNA-binding MarR family transcriptional regulator